MEFKGFDLAISLNNINALDDLEAFMGRHFKQLGFDSFLYCRSNVVDRRFLKTGQVTFPVTHYPLEYLSRYEKEEYFRLDPVIHSCIYSGQPCCWNLLDSFELSPIQKRMTNERRDCGLHAGISIPIFGGENGYSGFSLASDKENGFYKNLDDKGDLLFSSILFFHNYLQPFLDEIKNCILSKRQIDCLKWLVEGLSSKQIASRMNIQEDTVNKHIQAIKDKLKANNRIEAVVKAIKAGFISI